VLCTVPCNCTESACDRDELLQHRARAPVVALKMPQQMDGGESFLTLRRRKIAVEEGSNWLSRRGEGIS
jgi:hypothetical protein